MPASTRADTADVHIIRAVERAPLTALRDAWRRRGVFLSLLLREIQVRYRQAWLGVVWALLQPLALMVVTTLVFHRVLHVDVPSMPYALFVLTGLLPWTFFHTAVSAAVVSLVGNAELVRKIYFPREALPVAAVGGATLDLLVGTCLWLLAIVLFGRTLPLTVLWLPFFLLLLMATTLGPALLLAALNVHARDVKHALPLVLQVLFFATPIVYPLDAVPSPWRGVLLLNPLTAVVDGLRRTGVEGVAPRLDVTIVGVAIAGTGLLLAYGVFLRAGRRFADIV